ncbi:hypothetical protein [Limnoglobus roseus]|uniref:Carboxypeptidase regulatory-like domain-containing protein n=1 Tax=Limnoglobus roseus TaxID=2598579 RepID=A0A5C1AN94_9BACT|nr:hypothetical protein [Limnoglobus roseus]QEL20879.1 carboxypeptidase regulatory-like domain-containing protein [Limnoglobus roseus]
MISFIVRSLGLAIVTTSFAIAAIGCGGGGTGPKVNTVSGKVTLDGAPIPEGTISFRNLAGNKGSFSGPIVNGDYSVKAESGEMAVEIRATRVVPDKFDTTTNPGHKEPVIEMYVPKEYNSATTLKTSITGTATLPPFELKSGKK